MMDMTDIARLAESTIIRSQSVVASNFPNVYYNTYRQHERDYWGSIPAWIWEDLENRTNAYTYALDIGCAYGTLLTYLWMLTCEVRGLDQRKYISTSLENYLNMDFMVCNIETDLTPLDWPGNKVVVMTEVLEHLNCHPSVALSRIKPLLAADGYLYLSTPNADQWGQQTKYYQSLDAIPTISDKPFIDDHIWHYTKAELMTVLEVSGYKIVRLEEGKHLTVTAELAK